MVRRTPADVIASAKMGEFVTGRGITSYATAAETEKRTNGQEAEDEEEEEDDLDWFCTRLALGPSNGSGD